MGASILPKGLIADLVTPVLPDGSIDGTGLGRHLDRMLPCVQGVFISGPDAGDGTGLSIEQKAELFDKALVVIRGAVPVFAWITGPSEEDTHKILDSFQKKQAARNYKGSIFWVDSPLYYHSNRGLPEYYEKLGSKVDTNLVLHNSPALICRVDKALKRKNIRTSILKELSKNQKIAGLIFSGSLDRSHNYKKAVRARSDFTVYDGDESVFLDHPGKGGVVSMGANIAPLEWKKITESSLNQNNENAYPDQQQQMWELWEFLSELRSLYSENSAKVLKKVLSDLGVISSSPEYESADISEAAGGIKTRLKAQGSRLKEKRP